MSKRGRWGNEPPSNDGIALITFETSSLKESGREMGRFISGMEICGSLISGSWAMPSPELSFEVLAEDVSPAEVLPGGVLLEEAPRGGLAVDEPVFGRVSKTPSSPASATISTSKLRPSNKNLCLSWPILLSLNSDVFYSTTGVP